MRKSIVTLAVLTLLVSGVYYKTQHALADPHGHVHEENEKEPAETDNKEHDSEESHGNEEGVIHMNDAQITKAGIATATASVSAVTTSLSLPGQIVLADDRRAVVTPRARGMVQKVLKNIGDTVAAGEGLAVIESPDMAEAAAEYLAAQRAESLASTVYQREERLWKEKVTAEQDYLNARNAHQEAKIRLNLAAQKMRAAGQEPGNAASGSSYTLASSIAGRVIRRDLTLGAYVDTTHTAFEIADTSLLWLEAAIPASDLPAIAEQQEATVSSGDVHATGTVIFISPTVDAATRTAKAVVALSNPDGTWRAGTFATATMPTKIKAEGLSIPITALQTIEGKTAVFVKTDEGFTLREIKAGAKSGERMIIESGLNEGEMVATDNAFILKAELGKSEAGHEH